MARYQKDVESEATLEDAAVLPARALIVISGSRGTPVDPQRFEIGFGEHVPEELIAADKGLVEGVHYTRGELKVDPPKKVTFAGKEAKTAKTFIIGHKPGFPQERYEFSPGEVVPIDQLGGLTEGVHYE